MLYDGKRPSELSDEELEAAQACCERTLESARSIYLVNTAAIQELQQERWTRAGEVPPLDPYIQRAIDRSKG